MTRSGEDVWEDSWDDNDYSNLDINDLEDLGEGVYTDGNGHYYIDIDYDGDIDLETIAPGYVEDEEQEEPEKPETPMPDQGDENEDVGNEGNEGDDTGEDDEFQDNDYISPELPDHLPNVSDLFDINQHFTKYNDAGDCLKCCKSIMDKMGQINYGSSADVIYLVRENDDHTALVHYGEVSRYYTVVTDCVNRHLDAGLAIIAGVDHTLETKRNDGTIDHFVLIVGRIYNENTQLYELIYVETGTDSPKNGYNSENRFVYDQTTGMYVDSSARFNTYTLTELRPNDGDNSGTIVQPAKRIFRFFKMI